MPERIVFGVKNCDLSSLAVFDFVFLDGVAKDPYYAEAREKTILISSDCSSPREACFCPAVGEQPWAKRGFDIDIGATIEGYVIEDGSARGARLLKPVEEMLEPADSELLEELEQQRSERYDELVDQCQVHGLAPREGALLELQPRDGLIAEVSVDAFHQQRCQMLQFQGEPRLDAQQQGPFPALSGPLEGEAQGRAALGEFPADDPLPVGNEAGVRKPAPSKGACRDLRKCAGKGF